VVTALAESRDITLYLSPLMKHFLQFEETDFSESKPLLKPLLHVVCLVRKAVFYEICTEKSFTIIVIVSILVVGQLKLLSHIIKVNRFT
jgi:dynein heavy chain